MTREPEQAVMACLIVDDLRSARTREQVTALYGVQPSASRHPSACSGGHVTFPLRDKDAKSWILEGKTFY